MKETLNFITLSLLIDQTTSLNRKKVLKNFFVLLKFIDSKEINLEQEKALQLELKNHSPITLSEMKTWRLKANFRKLQRFINKEFGYTHKGHYTAYFMSIGMVLGMSLGTAIFHFKTGLSTGMLFGLFLGMLYGKTKDQSAEMNNLVYYLKS